MRKVLPGSVSLPPYHLSVLSHSFSARLSLPADAAIELVLRLFQAQVSRLQISFFCASRDFRTEIPSSILFSPSAAAFVGRPPHFDLELDASGRKRWGVLPPCPDAGFGPPPSFSRRQMESICRSAIPWLLNLGGASQNRAWYVLPEDDHFSQVFLEKICRVLVGFLGES